MKKTILNLALVSMLGISFSSAVAENIQQCQDRSFTLQLLGSGGPISDDARGSASAVVWMDGKSKILIDAGGGSYLRFGQSGARIEDLDIIDMTHFHADHASDIPAILKGAYFSDRKTDLAMSGPTHGSVFPSMSEFFSRLFDKDKGAFAYLHGLATGTDGFFKISPIVNVDYKKLTPTKVYSNDEYTVWALGIPKGDVPTLAYKIVSKQGTIVMAGAGGRNGNDEYAKKTREAFIKFAKGADILVMPTPIDEHDKSATFLHAKPSTVGKVAAEINPKVLVLDHFLGRGLMLKDETVTTVKKYYKGPVYAGRDLSCFPVDGIK